MEPFGAWRDNWHMAVFASMYANAHRKPGGKAMSPADFFYMDQQTRQERADAEMLAKFEALARG